jgi:Zn-dependent peptidase ImmA (M78 family)/DNA-binding XRE family transcriptional regulator
MADSFNPSRLVLARKRQGWTKAQLASEANLSTRILFAYERFEKEPSPDTLSVLADLLRFPVDFFYGPDLDEPSLESASFRSLKKLTARNRDQALASGALALALSDWIGSKFHLPEPSIPIYDETIDSEVAAQGVRAEWGLGERPIKNMIHMLEAHGVRVFSLREECRHLDAFSLWRNGVPYVFLNTGKSPEHMRMDGAHELGHLVLHRTASPGRDVEREAKAFASAFLMPEGSIRATAPRRGTLPALIQAKRQWNTSLAALTYRIHALGLMSDWQYRSLFVEMSSNGYLINEPHGCQAEVSEVLAKVMRSLREDGVTLATVARDLRIYPDELNKLVFGLVLTEIRGDGTLSGVTDASQMTIEHVRPFVLSLGDAPGSV